MLLIAAAMEEELQVAISLCRDRRTIRSRGVGLRLATRNGQTISFLKTGVGPRRSAASLEQTLEAIQFSHILVIGYGGALAPDLKLGNLIAIERALACSLDKSSPALEQMRLDDVYELANGENLIQAAKSVGLEAHMGDVLTSAYVLGNPEHKRFLFERFHASVADMETAALARIAKTKAIPLSCIRVVSDEAQDTFLAPFSYDPSVNVPARAARIIRKGNLVQAYRIWKDHASVARASLNRFLAHYL